MTESREDTWPRADEPTLVEHETVVAAPPPPDRRIGWGMLLALVVVALIVLGGVLAWLVTHRSNHKTTTTVIVSTQQANTGTTSATPPAAQVTMPDFQGQTLRAARTSLDAAGLKSTVTKVTSPKPPGTVVDQAPDAGAKLAKGSTVTLSVSQPPQPAATAPTTTAVAQPTTASVPDLSGQNEQQAVQALDQAGILASLVFVPSDRPLGAVVQQAKETGTIVPFHSHVQVNLSRGTNQNPDQTVPNVIGRTLTEAVSAMHGANLRLIFLKSAVTSRAQAGKIVQQSPLGGGNAPHNAQVLVYLGAFKAQ